MGERMRFKFFYKSFGFTVIELVIVIVVLGVLAAFTLSRFIDIKSPAQLNTLEYTKASILSAANIAHVKWQVSGQPSSIIINGETVSLVNGYPSPNSIVHTMKTSGFQVVANNSRALFRLEKSRIPSQCRIRYRSAEPGQLPRVDTIVNGCA